MSFLNIPFLRLKNNSTSNNDDISLHETTQTTQIANLDRLMLLMDGRISLNNILKLNNDASEQEDDDDDTQSSISVTNNNYSMEESNHIRHEYNEDSEEEQLLAGDEAEQSLVGNNSSGGSGRNAGVDLEENSRRKKSDSSGRKWACMGFLVFLLLFWLVWTIGLSQMGPVTDPDPTEPLNHIDLPDLYNNSFVVQRPSLVWVKNDPRDGIFTYRDVVSGDIMLESVKDGSKEVFIKVDRLKVNNSLLDIDSFEISQDGQYLLFYTNTKRQWRHSSHSNMYIYNLTDHSLFPLNSYSSIGLKPIISYAVWSPTGHQIAYVMNNEIYITSDLVQHERITFDGSDTIFNGVPDWVYEEEVFGIDYTMWWSPDSTHLAYLRFNETAVSEFHLQYYTHSNNSYPDELTIKYPKAGTPNPLVSLHLHSLETNSTISITSSSRSVPVNTTLIKSAENYIEFEDSDRLITDVIWSTTTSTHLLFKQTNRIQNVEITSLVTLGDRGAINNQTTVETVRKYQPEDGGWVEPQQTMVYIPNSKANDTTVRYLDIIDDGNGFMHLAVLQAGDNNNNKKKKPRDPVWLTSGQWEVIPGTVAVDVERHLVHYTSTEKSHLERHLYRLSLNTTKPVSSTKTCLTCPNDNDTPAEAKHAYYSTKFSPKHGYYILQYDGPDVPYTVVKSVDNSTFESVLQDNAELKDVLKEYQLPRTRMVSVKSGGIDLDAMEVLPPNFDASKKYPVLFHVYGGPGSQIASYKFELGWSTFLASKLEYIIVTVDGRGTGFKGRDFRVGVCGRLGELETIDQINAARHWASLDYVDASRIAIWGWSYGGYMTSKVIEANSGVFMAGLAVAPVTDWRFYDSIYTERYMSTPQLNLDGYERSMVNNMTGFENAKFLLAHGTGDDNVHFQNSAVLVDKLTQANIHNYQVQFYSDSNHAIQYDNANPNLYYLLTDFLWESFGGEEYLHVRKELNGHFSGPLSGPH